MAKRERLAKKDPGNVYSLGGNSRTCGFLDNLLPVDMMEDFMAEKGRGIRKLVKPSEIAPPHFDPAYVLENKMFDDAESSLLSDYLDDLEPSLGIDNVTIQGMPLVVYLEMHNIDSDPPSLADGIPITQYVMGMSYDRVYPIITDDGKSGYDDDMIITQSSCEAEGMRRFIVSYSQDCRMNERCGRRYGKPPEQKPRYKNIPRQTHRTGCFMDTGE